MSDSTSVCTDCGSIGTLVYDQAAGTVACERCGTVAQSASSEQFEFVARVDEEDQTVGGRVYLDDRQRERMGGSGTQGIRGLGGRSGQWATVLGARSEMNTAKKKGETLSFIKRLLRLFDSTSKWTQACGYFERIQKKLAIRWGTRGNMFAAASAYVAMRQHKVEVYLHQLNDACNGDLGDPLLLARAVRIIKLNEKIELPEIDPVLFVERFLVHLQHVFQQPKPCFRHPVTKVEKPFNKKNLEWIRGLSLEEARQLSIRILRFSRGLYLVAGRSPEQVACAAVMVALEGIARQTCPKQQEFDEELASMTNTATFTIQERYREYIKALTDYAPEVPWIGDKAKKWKKKELIGYTNDIVSYWTLAHAKKEREKGVEGGGRSEGGGTIGIGKKRKAEVLEEEEEENEGLVEDDVGGSGEDSDDEPILPDDFSLPDPLATLLAAAQYGFDGPKSTKKSGKIPSRKGKSEEDRQQRPKALVRGTSEWKRAKNAEIAAASGLYQSPSADTASQSPIESTSSRDNAYFPDLVSAPSASLPSPPPPDRASVAINQLLLSGNTPDDIRDILAPGTNHKASKKKDTRLHRLLWEKSANEIEDDELFDDGELESYIRTADEALAVRKTTAFADMIKASKERSGRRTQLTRPRRFIRGERNPEHEALEEEAKARGMSMGAVLESRARRARGEPEEYFDVVGGTLPRGQFRPRQKKTKISAEARERLAALLAEGGDSDDEEEEQEEQPEWVGLAMDAARDAGTDLPGAGDPDNEDDDAEPAADDYVPEVEEDEDEAWRREFRYAANDGNGYDDD